MAENFEKRENSGELPEKEKNTTILICSECGRGYGTKEVDASEERGIGHGLCSACAGKYKKMSDDELRKLIGLK
jgi:formylmethanofuran dehydrogenase subunit E